MISERIDAHGHMRAITAVDHAIRTCGFGHSIAGYHIDGAG